MGNFTPGGSFPAFLQPTQTKELYDGNYLNFTSDSHNQWAQQFMPDLYKKIAPKYGSNQTIAGFLKMITNGEMSANSDQIIWQEEGRLHTRYESLFGATASGATDDATITASATFTATAAAAYYLKFSLPSGTNAGQAAPGPIDQNFGPLQQQNSFDGSNLGVTLNFRVGQTVMIQKEDTTEAVIKGVVTDVNVTNRTFVIGVYNKSAVSTVAATTATYTALVYGSEFGKGTGNFTDKLDAQYNTYANQLIILKEHYSINGTDLSQVGWIDTGEGYLWYHKSKSDNMKRWNDYMEMALVEGVVQEGTGAGLAAGLGDYGFDASISSQRGQSTSASVGGGAARGTEGFFQSLEKRGNVYQGFGDEAAGGGALTDFDNLLKQLDKQGSIEENMIYTDRDLSLEIDDILAQQNSYGAGGTSWGAFNNSEKMALDLGFSGFRRGSYDFYKTDWRYLNDHSTRGGFSDIEGVLIPAGTSTVYEKFGNGKVKRPFLHVRYREGRQMKNWITGGAGGASTSDIDEVRHHYLTERCLITQAANNFVLFKK